MTNEKSSVCARQGSYSWIQLGPPILPHAATWLMGKYREVAIRSGPFKGVSVKGSCCDPCWDHREKNASEWANGAAAKQQGNLLLHRLDEDNLTSVQTLESRSVGTSVQPHTNHKHFPILNVLRKGHSWVSHGTHEQMNWRNPRKTRFSLLCTVIK